MTYHWTEDGPVSTVELAEMIRSNLEYLDHDDPAAEEQRDLLEELRREYPEDFPRETLRPCRIWSPGRRDHARKMPTIRKTTVSRIVETAQNVESGRVPGPENTGPAQNA